MVPFATLLSIVSCLFASRIQAFAPPRTLVISIIDPPVANNRHYGATSTSLLLSSSPTPSTGDRPPPRRTLKKRKNKRRQRMDEQSKNIRGLNSNTHNNNNFHNREISLEDDDDDDVEIEIRPIRKRKAIEAGLDYWIDDGDLKREKIRKKAVKNRKAMEGEISKEKLREEVVAPYKQNWIGIFSVVIVMLSAIGTTFPELLQVPVIPIPDL